MNRARIVALAGECPTTLLDDAALAVTLGLDADRVRALSRGLLRASASDGDGPANLAARVAAEALKRAAIDASGVELIVFATTTPDITFPGSACLLQALLDVHDQACIDVRSQCTGFLTAMDVASRFLATGTYRRALVAAADVPTHVNRYDGVAPELAILTGDGAAVAVLEGASGRGEVLASVTRIDGRRHRDFWCEFPASRHLGRRQAARGERVTRAAFAEGAMFPRVDLAALRDTALTEVPTVLADTLSRADLQRADVVLLAHLDPMVEDLLEERIAPFCGRVIRRRCAYAFGSTLPLMLADADRSGEVEAGQTVALVTAGSGASWGAAVLRW